MKQLSAPSSNLLKKLYNNRLYFSSDKATKISDNDLYKIQYVSLDT